MAEPVWRNGRGWMIAFKDPTRPPNKQWRKMIGSKIPGLRGKQEAVIRLAMIEQKLAPVKLGVITPQQARLAEESGRSIDEVMIEFRKYLEGRRVSKAHINVTVGDCKAICKTCGFMSLAAIEAAKVEAFLSDVIAEGKSANRRNRYRASIMQLMHWGLKRNKIASNPLVVIEKLSEDKDRRRVRRALTHDEFWWLLDYTKNLKRGGGIRTLYYWLACRVGLRWTEIRRLRRKHLLLDDQRPMVCMDASLTKNGRDAELVIDDDLAKQLRHHYAVHRSLPESHLFDGEVTRITWKRDLQRARDGWIKAAGNEVERRARAESDFLMYQTPDGCAYRGALRTTYCTHMYEAGVDIRLAQERMRHSDINLTARVYTRLQLKDQQKAADMLRRPEPAEAAKTA